MEERIFDFISATFGVSFAVACVVFLLVIWLTHYVTKKVTEIKASHNEIANGLEKSEKHIDEMRRDISYIKGTLDIIKSGNSPLMQSHSPISLTEEGVAVAKELDADRLITLNWERIKGELIKLGQANAYDIQQYCIETADVDAHLFFDSATLDKIKTYAYEKGKPVQLYLRLLGVIIRDKFFQEQGIPLSRIDETAPQSQE